MIKTVILKIINAVVTRPEFDWKTILVNDDSWDRTWEGLEEKTIKLSN